MFPSPFSSTQPTLFSRFCIGLRILLSLHSSSSTGREFRAGGPLVCRSSLCKDAPWNLFSRLSPKTFQCPPPLENHSIFFRFYFKNPRPNADQSASVRICIRSPFSSRPITKVPPNIKQLLCIFLSVTGGFQTRTNPKRISSMQ